MNGGITGSDINGMTLLRYKELETTDAELTKEEIEEGWHFCWDWDGLLIHPNDEEYEVCSCPNRITVQRR